MFPFACKDRVAITVIGIASVCHEANRAYCESINDWSQKSWCAAPEWQRESAIKGVEFLLANPDAGPQASHESWLAEKYRTGWKYGPVKDPLKKEHPCYRPYEELAPEQKIKDTLFHSIVRALAPALEPPNGQRIGVDPAGTVAAVG